MRTLAFGVKAGLFGMALTIVPLQAAERDATPGQAETLDVVEVAGEAGGVAELTTLGTTEGSHSYTTHSARTATPLGLSLRETPQSVSVVTQQRIEDQNLNTILDVANHAIGVSVNRYETNRAQFTSRGFKINRLMIDGVPTIWEQPWSSGEVFSSLAMYDRVEIVRGANGLMTGAGNPSASINLVHKRARSKTLDGSLALSAGRWDQYGVLADVSSALNRSGSVRGRLVLEHTDGDSWIDMHSNQRDLIYGTVDVDLGDSTVLWLGFSHQKSQSESPMWGGLPVWFADGSRTDWSRSKTTSADWSAWDSTYDNAFVNLEHFFANGWHARLGYSRGERDGDSRLLYLFGNPPVMFASPGSYLTETVQDDVSLQLAGPFELLGRHHQAAFGYVWSNQKFEAKQRAASNFPATIPDFGAYQGDFPEPTWGAPTFYEGSETTQQGLYAMARFSVADPLHLIVGARFNRYEKTGHGRFTAPYDLSPDDELTPYAGLVYDFTQHLSGYVSYTSIFQPQSVRDQQGEVLEPIIGNSTELGLKGEYLGGRLNSSLALFRIQQDNLGQATGKFVDGTVNESAYATSEGATSEGFEIQVSGELATGWNATLGYTWFQLEDAEGDEINTLYPTELLRLFTTYRLPGDWRALTVGGGVSWQNATYTYAANPSGNAERIEQEAYSLVSLMARYRFSEQLSAQLNVNNAFDETYFDVFDSFGALTYGAPRAVTASLKYDF